MRNNVHPKQHLLSVALRCYVLFKKSYITNELDIHLSVLHNVLYRNAHKSLHYDANKRLLTSFKIFIYSLHIMLESYLLTTTFFNHVFRWHQSLPVPFKLSWWMIHSFAFKSFSSGDRWWHDRDACAHMPFSHPVAAVTSGFAGWQCWQMTGSGSKRQ